MSRWPVDRRSIASVRPVVVEIAVRIDQSNDETIDRSNVIDVTRRQVRRAIETQREERTNGTRVHWCRSSSRLMTNKTRTNE
jgi:hypothetical protein